MAGVWHSPPADRIAIVGVLNVTPDSFYDGGRTVGPEAVVRGALQMRDEGADAIDVGGESTRPGAEPVPLAEEIARSIPAIEAVHKTVSLAVSIDTRRAEVAARAIAAGASCVNAVAGLRDDPAIADVCADTGAALVLNHMRGSPRSMQERPQYDDVVEEVRAELIEAAETAQRAGVSREHIWLDPGLGFGKHPIHHNLPLIARLGALIASGYPILVGASRKSFIARLTGAPVGERLPGSLAALTACVLAGARAVRVHDVAPSRQAADVARAIAHAREVGS